MENMCFRYKTEAEAKKKIPTVRAYRKKNEHQKIYDVYRVDNCIYIARTGGKK